MHATLYVTMSVHWSVGPSVGPSVGLKFQIRGGCKFAIFPFSKLKFDMVYFGLINSLTVAKIFSCENGTAPDIAKKIVRYIIVTIP